MAAEEETAARVGDRHSAPRGNACDAAVAVAFALAVTWPEAAISAAAGSGSRATRGGGSRRSTSGKPRRARRAGIFSRPRRPAAGRPLPRRGRWLGSAGRWRGWPVAHRRGGRLPWKTVVSPAVKLARDGFPMTENISGSIAAYRAELAKDPETARIFLRAEPSGRGPSSGSGAGPDAPRDPGPRRRRLLPRRNGPRLGAGSEAERRPHLAGRPRALAKRRSAARSVPVRGRRNLHDRGPPSGHARGDALAVERAGSAKLRTPGGGRCMGSRDRKRAFRDAIAGWRPLFPRVNQRLFTDPARIARLVASIDRRARLPPKISRGSFRTSLRPPISPS